MSTYLFECIGTYNSAVKLGSVFITEKVGLLVGEIINKEEFSTAE